MDKRLSPLMAFFLCGVLLIVSFSGCIEEEQKKKDLEELLEPETELDQPSVLPNWKDGKYHDYDSTNRMLYSFDQKYPDFVEITSIGKSVLGKDILCVCLTNENISSNKYSCLIDGCIHGNEWETVEACLYLAEYLIINNGDNSTITNMLNTAKVYIVPIVNPDGRQSDERWNDNGIDLNRNFDAHFGRLIGGNYPLGKLFGFIKIPMIKHPLRKYIVLDDVSTNCGRRPFSEPETQAVQDLMQSMKRYSFYVNCHTAQHCVISIVDVNYKPEFEPTEHEEEIINVALDWIDENTEYGVAHVDDVSFPGAGFAHHWVFKEFRIPSFCFEMLLPDYDPYFGHGKHDNLVYWMKTTLPVFIYLLCNIENLYNWENPEIQPSLPEGVPPPPLKE